MFASRRIVCQSSDQAPVTPLGDSESGMVQLLYWFPR